MLIEIGNLIHIQEENHFSDRPRNSRDNGIMRRSLIGITRHDVCAQGYKANMQIMWKEMHDVKKNAEGIH